MTYCTDILGTFRPERLSHVIYCTVVYLILFVNHDINDILV